MHQTDGLTTVRAGNLLDTQHWHYVTIKRYGRQVNFTLDSQTEMTTLNGEFNYLDLDSKVGYLHKYTCKSLMIQTLIADQKYRSIKHLSSRQL